MLPRHQSLMLAGTLVVGMTIGSVATALILPVVRPGEKPARPNQPSTPTALARVDRPPAEAEKSQPASPAPAQPKPALDAGKSSPEAPAPAKPQAIPPGPQPGPVIIPTMPVLALK